jgi:hypothetical protein
MIKIGNSIIINRPVETVWSFVSNPDNSSKYDQGVSKCGQPPMGLPGSVPSCIHNAGFWGDSSARALGFQTRSGKPSCSFRRLETESRVARPSNKNTKRRMRRTTSGVFVSVFPRLLVYRRANLRARADTWVGPYFAISVARFSRMTVTRIWPG